MAGVAGIILPAGLLAWTALMTGPLPESPRCGEYTGCLGFLVQARLVGRWGAIFLAWPLPHLLRMRPAWPVATVAALFLVTIWTIAEALPFSMIEVSLALVVFGGVIAYPAAARLLTPRARRRGNGRRARDDPARRS